MKKIAIKLALREILLIRALYWPLKRLRGWIDYNRYRKSGEGERLRAFRNIHAGESCFIIGNGPSLTIADLEKIQGYASFASNRIYKLFDQTDWRPTYWMCVDENVLRADAQKIPSLGTFTCFVSAYAKGLGLRAGEKIFFIYNHQPFHVRKYGGSVKLAFSERVDITTEAGETVTYNAIQMAAYMGFKRIYLLGVDHNYSQKIDQRGKLVIDPTVKDYFLSVKTESFNIQNISVSTRAYEMARQYCDAHGIEIYNATRQGKLEAFERKALESVVK